MTAEELLDKHMEFTIKKHHSVVGEIFQAFIYCEAQAKNGKWYRVAATFPKIIEERDLRKSDRGVLVEEFKALAKHALAGLMTSRTGIKGHRGYFKFQDFGAITY